MCVEIDSSVLHTNNQDTQATTAPNRESSGETNVVRILDIG